MIRNGVVRYDTAAPTAKVTAAVPENDTVPDSIPIQAKDTYIAGSGVCGIGFSAGANHVLLVHCQDCEEDQFLRERSQCCTDPAKCMPPANETCYRFGGASQEILCTQAGCESLSAPVPVSGTSTRVTRCVARVAENEWEARLVPDINTPATIRLRAKDQKLYETYDPTRAREEMDRPSYHVREDQEIHLVSGMEVNLFDTDTGGAYVYVPDEDNPEKMAFTFGDSAAKSVEFEIYNDRTPLGDPSGTQLARIEVKTAWDPQKHYDLREHGGNLEFVYDTESKVPFLVLSKGVLRGTALVKIGTKNVTLVPATTKNVANPGKYTEEPTACQGIADSHERCFSGGTGQYAACAAALHSASAVECCGNLFHKGIYFSCAQ